MAPEETTQIFNEVCIMNIERLLHTYQTLEQCSTLFTNLEGVLPPATARLKDSVLQDTAGVLMILADLQMRMNREIHGVNGWSALCLICPGLGELDGRIRATQAAAFMIEKMIDPSDFLRRQFTTGEIDR